MCLVIAIFLIVFGVEFYEIDIVVSSFSIIIGSIMFTIFLYRFSTYKKRKRDAKNAKQ